MSLQQTAGQYDWDLVSLVLRNPNLAAFIEGPWPDRGRQRKSTARRCALDERCVVGPLRQMPQARQLTRVQQTRADGWQRRQYP